jgi:hypothetical protein
MGTRPRKPKWEAMGEMKTESAPHLSMKKLEA